VSVNSEILFDLLWDASSNIPASSGFSDMGGSDTSSKGSRAMFSDKASKASYNLASEQSFDGGNM